ncbi:MAG: LPS export ABC transporter permease LptG [Candidatus Accumulibacter sp.]|jgi:lipopolysaccharide export system permease protein|nr:LPS export ABC transporter permease LptG [Accumulibacter sp.]
MKIYRRYLAREIAGGIALVLAAFLALFAFFDMINEVKSVGDASYQLVDALLFVTLRLPSRIYELMPVAVLIGTLYALASLARHSEIAVLRASGVSTKELLTILFQVAFAFALVTFVVGEFVMPFSERAAQQLRIRERGRTMGQGLRSGVWIKDDLSIINVRVVLPDNYLRDIFIYDFEPGGRLRSITEAAEGEYVSPAVWRLDGVARTLIEDTRSQIVHLPEMQWNTALNPDILAVLMVSPERMSLTHLAAYTRHLSDNGQKTQRYDIAMWKKVLYPLAALVMVALALPFGYTHNRVSGVSLKIFSGVMIGVLFHMLNGLFSNLGAINGWSPFLSAVAPSVLFMLAAAAMILWIERR